MTDRAWESHLLEPWQTVISIDGQKLHGRVWRRVVMGVPQYKAMSEEEELREWADGY